MQKISSPIPLFRDPKSRSCSRRSQEKEFNGFFPIRLEGMCAFAFLLFLTRI